MPRLVHEIRIGLTEDGNVIVAGPIDDKILCYGMLEAAKDAVRQHKEKKASIQVPPPGLAGALANGHPRN